MASKLDPERHRGRLPLASTITSRVQFITNFRFSPTRLLNVRRSAVIVLLAFSCLFAARPKQAVHHRQGLVSLPVDRRSPGSPDGAHVVFVRVTRQREERQLRHFALDGRDGRLGRPGAADERQARFAAALVSGRQVDCVCARQRASRRKTASPLPSQLALLSLAGGEAWVITDMPTARAIRSGRPTESTSHFCATPMPTTLPRSRRKTPRPSRNMKAT